jgi:hypothetical protein
MLPTGVASAANAADNCLCPCHSRVCVCTYCGNRFASGRVVQIGRPSLSTTNFRSATMADARKVGKNPRTKSDSTTLLSKQQARQLVKTTAALQSGSHLAKALSKIDPTTKACRSGTAWYQQYEEPGQTYTEYTMAAPKVMHPHRLQPTRRNIYLQVSLSIPSFVDSCSRCVHPLVCCLQPIDPCTQSSGATAGMSPDLNVLAQLLATYIPGIQVPVH